MACGDAGPFQGDQGKAQHPQFGLCLFTSQSGNSVAAERRRRSFLTKPICLLHLRQLQPGPPHNPSFGGEDTGAKGDYLHDQGKKT